MKTLLLCILITALALPAVAGDLTTLFVNGDEIVNAIYHKQTGEYSFREDAYIDLSGAGLTRHIRVITLSYEVGRYDVWKSVEKIYELTDAMVADPDAGWGDVLHDYRLCIDENKMNNLRGVSVVAEWRDPGVPILGDTVSGTKTKWRQ